MGVEKGKGERKEVSKEERIKGGIGTQSIRERWVMGWERGREGREEEIGRRGINEANCGRKKEGRQ